MTNTRSIGILLFSHLMFGRCFSGKSNKHSEHLVLAAPTTYTVGGLSLPFQSTISSPKAYRRSLKTLSRLFRAPLSTVVEPGNKSNFGLTSPDITNPLIGPGSTLSLFSTTLLALGKNIVCPLSCTATRDPRELASHRSAFGRLLPPCVEVEYRYHIIQTS